MKQRLPFQKTKVAVSKTMAEILDRLRKTGFTQTAQIQDGGHYRVTAAFEGVEFDFQVQVEVIVKAIVTTSSREKQSAIRRASPQGKFWFKEAQEQAERIGWRLLGTQIKSICDSIDLGVTDRAEAFAGNLVLGHTDGQRITLGTRLKQLASNGQLNSPTMFTTLQLPEGTK